MTRPESPPATAAEMLARGRAFLERQGFEEARLDAELLVAHALGLDRLHLFLAFDRPLLPEDVTRGRELLVRRSKGEPVAYITGEREWYGRAFRVGPGVLVPRPETELLVDRARELARELRAATAAASGAGQQAHGPGEADDPSRPGAADDPSRPGAADDPSRSGSGLRIGEVGVGSGCIAITLALELPGAEVRGVDISERALEYARDNAERLGADVELALGDGPEALPGAAPGAFDLLVSNPPYVAHPEDGGAADRAAPDVVAHEPGEALFAPAGDPDHWLRRLRAAAETLLAPGGVLLVELGADQAVRLDGAQHASDALTHRDLAGHVRLYEWRRPLEAGS